MNRRSFLKVLGAAIAAPFLVKAKPASDPYKGDDRARQWNEQAEGLSVENLNHARDVLSSRTGIDGEKLSIAPEYHVYPPEVYVLDCFFDARLGPETGKAIIGCVGEVFDFGNRIILHGWGFLKCPADFNRLESEGIIAGYTIAELKQKTEPDSLIALFEELGDPENDIT